MRKIYLKENNFWKQVYPFFSDLGINAKVIFVKSKKEIKETNLYNLLQFPGGSYPHPDLVKVARDISNNLLDLAIKKKYLQKNYKGIKNIFLIRDQAREIQKLIKLLKNLQKKMNLKFLIQVR